MRISLKPVLVAMAGVLAMSMPAQALTITAPIVPVVNCVLSPVCLAGFGTIANGNDNNVPAISADMAPIMGLANAAAVMAAEAYKQDVGGLESGVAAPYYTTTFSNDNGNALFHWDGPLFATATPLWLLVKDGSQLPAWYLYRITVGGATGWDGKEDIILQNFWPDQGSISHISFYGTPGNPTLFNTPVPDGGSMSMLLGMGLMGLAAVRRRMGRK